MPARARASISGTRSCGTENCTSIGSICEQLAPLQITHVAQYPAATVGFDTAPGVFDVDGDGFAYVVDPTAGDPAEVVAAARSCPLSAIRVWDDDGSQLAG